MTSPESKGDIPTTLKNAWTNQILQNLQSAPHDPNPLEFMDGLKDSMQKIQKSQPTSNLRGFFQDAGGFASKNLNKAMTELQKLKGTPNVHLQCPAAHGISSNNKKGSDSSSNINQTLSTAITALDKYKDAHPILAAIGGSGVFLGLSSGLVGPLLGAFGLSSIGPVAGTLVATWQASMGGSVTSSLFSFLQSTSMGSPAERAISGIEAAGGIFGISTTSLGLAMDKVKWVRDVFASGNQTIGTSS
ncbi:MAG: hypothetical protein M1834_005933 [Cirrosporium novae-zelandiae]|nr:MAG: hypothetical protein M1834_005933 [Cirrosporium novae-zelandiae]